MSLSPTPQRSASPDATISAALSASELKLARAWAELGSLQRTNLLPPPPSSLTLSLPSPASNWTSNVLPECRAMAKEFSHERQFKLQAKAKLIPQPLVGAARKADRVRELFASSQSPSRGGQLLLRPSQQYTLGKLVAANGKSLLVCEYVKQHHLLTIAAWLGQDCKHGRSRRRVLITSPRELQLEYAFSLLAVFASELNLKWNQQPLGNVEDGVWFLTQIPSTEVEFDLIISVGKENDWKVFANRGGECQIVLLVEAKMAAIQTEWFEPPSVVEPMDGGGNVDGEEAQEKELDKKEQEDGKQSNVEDEPAAKRTKQQAEEEDLSQLLFDASASPGLNPLAAGEGALPFDMGEDLSQLLLCPSPNADQQQQQLVPEVPKPTRTPDHPLLKHLASPPDQGLMGETKPITTSKVLMIESCVAPSELPKTGTKYLCLVRENLRPDRMCRMMEWIRFCTETSSGGGALEVTAKDLAEMLSLSGFLFELDTVVIKQCLLFDDEWQALDLLFATSLTNKRVHVFRVFSTPDHRQQLEGCGLLSVTNHAQPEKSPVSVLKTVGPRSVMEMEMESSYFSGKLPALALRRHCASVSPAQPSLLPPLALSRKRLEPIKRGEGEYKFVVSFFDAQQPQISVALPPQLPPPRPFCELEDLQLRRMGKNLKLSTDIINRSRFHRQRCAPGPFRTVKQVEERILLLKQQNLLLPLEPEELEQMLQQESDCTGMASLAHVHQVLAGSERCRPKPPGLVHPNRGLLDRVLNGTASPPPIATTTTTSSNSMVRISPKQFILDNLPKSWFLLPWWWRCQLLPQQLHPFPLPSPLWFQRHPPRSPPPYNTSAR
ncbi:hypothetical protein BASA81_007104 [Batrachochytrium salamandrivorans]|nr:hypothetical protein BASA81_007104 [Batrachochytrium salamandrivorans]